MLYTYQGIVTNVVDGDTFDVDVDMGFHIHNHIRVRLLNIDTPESRGVEKELGKICTAIAKSTFLGQSVVINTVRTDSFGRWLARIWYKDGTTIEELYNSMGINKLSESYSEDSVMKYKNFVEKN